MRSIELLRYRLGRVVELLEQVGLWHILALPSQKLGIERTHSNGEVVAPGELGNLARVPEGGTHNNRVVAVLLVVVEDVLYALDTGVLGRAVLLLGRRLVPVKNAADERRDEVSTSLSSADSLDEREHEGQVAVDAVLRLEDLGGLDALPCRGDLDEDALLGNADLLVELPVVSASAPPMRAL